MQIAGAITLVNPSMKEIPIGVKISLNTKVFPIHNRDINTLTYGIVIRYGLYIHDNFPGRERGQNLLFIRGFIMGSFAKIEVKSGILHDKDIIHHSSEKVKQIMIFFLKKVQIQFCVKI